MQAFHEDLNGRQHINEVFKFSVDKLYDILFTESQFMSDFMEQRRISGQLTSDPCKAGVLCCRCHQSTLFCFLDVVYHPWKKEDAGNQTREIMYTISLSNPLAPKTSTASETQVQSPPSLFTACGSEVAFSNAARCLFTRLCTKSARRASATSLMLRSSRMTCPTTITSTLSTTICSPGWPRTSVGYGE